MRLEWGWQGSTAGDYFYDLDENSFFYGVYPATSDIYGVLIERLLHTASEDYWEWIPER